MKEIYIGTKIIVAEEMDEDTFLVTVNRRDPKTLPSDPEFVEKNPMLRSRPGYKVRYEDGYVSWSPKETFERAYRKITRKEADIILALEPSTIPIE